MSKYPILTTWGLRDMSRRGDWYTPSGNYWEIVNNGLLGGELLFDPDTKKVYGLALKEVKDADDSFIRHCEEIVTKIKASKVMTIEDARQILGEE